MLHLPRNLPAASWVASAPYDLARWRGQTGATRLLFLNLMPQKEVTEWDFARTLAATGANVQLIPLKIKGQTSKTTPESHMRRFYIDFEQVEQARFERMVITGAPLEQMRFEEVRYWPQLCRIMRWADTHVERTLYVCWAAQAGLYFHYGIRKHALPGKCFGVFPQDVLRPASPLMQGLAPTFLMPHSRHTAVSTDEAQAQAPAGLQIIARGPETGAGVMATPDLRRVFVTGHLEYEPYTLEKEYRRDLRKRLPISPPENYYNPSAPQEPAYAWRRDALRFYANWIGAESPCPSANQARPPILY